MTYFNFNTLYIIESLRPNEKKTGQSLYEDMKNYEFVHDKLTVQLCIVNNVEDWNDLMQNIRFECETKGTLPIIHLEVHGSEDVIQFTNGSTLGRDYVIEQLRQINIATKCNLFVTLAVCKGLYMLLETHIDKEMPFCGVVGPFEKIMSGDILLRYYEFYKTFFETFDVTQAFIALTKANDNLPQQYRYIHISELFYKVYSNYIQKGCNNEGMKNRALEAAEQNNFILRNRKGKRKFQRDFVNDEKRNREKFYREHSNTFFMLEQCPDNKERFEVPNSWRDLEKRCKHLYTV